MRPTLADHHVLVHIPPGRPQSNGLVEVFNRILDMGHGGERQRLMSAVVAHNNMPNTKHGVSPETLWRALRPMQSRWRNIGLKEMLHERQPSMTDEEWQAFLDKDGQEGGVQEFLLIVLS